MLVSAHLTLRPMSTAWQLVHELRKGMAVTLKIRMALAVCKNVMILIYFVLINRIAPIVAGMATLIIQMPMLVATIYAAVPPIGKIKSSAIEPREMPMLLVFTVWLPQAS